ncbi:MAG: ABC transporter permease subunit [Vicinamibacterales bacterium]
MQTRAVQLERPSAVHPLGTDNLGRDILSRVLNGARVSLGAALLALVLIVLVGVTAGLVSGYRGGWIDAALMRLADVVLAVPTFILVLAIVGLFRAGLAGVVLALCGVWWVRYARIVRGLVLAARERSFVESARALGAGDARILLRHLLPEVAAPVLVLATLDVGTMVLAVSAFNFLGLGAARAHLPGAGADRRRSRVQPAR